MRIRRFEVNPLLFTNMYLAWCEETREALIVDAPGGAGEAVAFIRSEKLDVRQIVITHGHPDHITAAGRLKKATGAAIAAHPLAQKRMQSAGMKLMSAGGLFFRLEDVERPLEDDEEMVVGRMRFRAIHTPGHTEDGLCLAGEGVVFTGDTLFAGAVGRSDLAGGSEAELTRSIRERLMTLPDGTRILPGHGPESSIEIERRMNPYLRIESVNG